jgi:hypothetical protein
MDYDMMKNCSIQNVATLRTDFSKLVELTTDLSKQVSRLSVVLQNQQLGQVTNSNNNRSKFTSNFHIRLG